MDILENYLRTRDLAEACGVSIQSFLRYVKKGAFPKSDFAEIGGRGHFWHKDRLELAKKLRQHLDQRGSLKTFRYDTQDYEKNTNTPQEIS